MHGSANQNGIPNSESIYLVCERRDKGENELCGIIVTEMERYMTKNRRLSLSLSRS